MENRAEKIRELVKKLNDASKAYYSEDIEKITNFEYDRMYEELEKLEKETGIVLAGSPTLNVGYEVSEELPKERHQSRMLSLDKTKDREVLAEWLGEQIGMMSWKLDGLTIVLTYENGVLVKAVTRGNGDVGEVVTPNARVFDNVPLAIPYKGTLVLRGEAVIKYSDFEKINSEIEGTEAKYKNPRNLCSGSVRQLNTKITAERHVNFIAFSLVSAEGCDFGNSKINQMEWLSGQGFDTVEYVKVMNGSEVKKSIENFAERIGENDFPSDGLVLAYDDIAYGRSLGRTAKFPRDAIAFKWKDETAETVLRKIEWSASRTGLINPIAVFDPVEIEGTTVSRASVHNVSILRELKLGEGDSISVYKANMIIPQIAENITKSGSAGPPSVCPVCGASTIIKNDNGVETLICPNAECPAKQIKSFTLFVSRDAMNIDGLSEATIEKLIAGGFIKEPADIFHIEKYRDGVTDLEGFGEKSFENLAASVEKARNTTMARFIYSLGIPGIGTANAKLIAAVTGNDPERVKSITKEELCMIDGIGDIMAENYRKFFDDDEKIKIAEDILREVFIEDQDEKEENKMISGKTFVITGKLENFINRNELKDTIERAGGKVSGSVSKNTSYLINNDSMSDSAKNKAARKLGIKVITEKQFIEDILNKNN